MEKIAAVASSALFFGIAGYFLGPSVGYVGIVPFLIFGLAGTFFGLLVLAVGAKALWIPVGVAIVGLVGVLAVQLMSPESFGIVYYVFVPMLAVLVITPLVSIFLLVFPVVRQRMFGGMPQKSTSEAQ